MHHNTATPSTPVSQSRPGLLPAPSLVAGSPAARLAAPGISLPEIPSPLANYAPHLVQEHVVYID